VHANFFVRENLFSNIKQSSACTDKKAVNSPAACNEMATFHLTRESRKN